MNYYYYNNNIIIIITTLSLICLKYVYNSFYQLSFVVVSRSEIGRAHV